MRPTLTLKQQAVARAGLAFALRGLGHTYADIAAILRLYSAETARALVARGRRYHRLYHAAEAQRN